MIAAWGSHAGLLKSNTPSVYVSTCGVRDAYGHFEEGGRVRVRGRDEERRTEKQRRLADYIKAGPAGRISVSWRAGPAWTRYLCVMPSERLHVIAALNLVNSDRVLAVAFAVGRGQSLMSAKARLSSNA